MSVWTWKLDHGRHMPSLGYYSNRSSLAPHFTVLPAASSFGAKRGLFIRDINEDTAQCTARFLNGMKAGIFVVPRGGRKRCASCVRLQGKSYDSYIEHLHLTSS